MFLSKSCIIYYLFVFHRFEWNIFVKYLRGWRDVDRLDGKSGVGGQNKVLSHNIQRQKIFTYYDIMDAFGICELENNEKAEFRKKNWIKTQPYSSFEQLS